jgi:hypothetical protein
MRRDDVMIDGMGYEFLGVFPMSAPKAFHIDCVRLVSLYLLALVG